MAALEPRLRPLPYHEALADHFQRDEPETWAWFTSAKSQSDYADSLRLELLKQTYRLDATSHPELHAAVAEAKSRLGLDAAVTVYQSQRNHGLNAAIHHLPGEAHIVLEGAVLQLLDAAELRGVLGHELAHHRLWTESDRRFLIADRIVHAMAGDPRAEPSHVESARLMRLYTEIYADRGALQVTLDPVPVISGLVKIQTSLAQVDAAGYVRQADEIFAKSKVRTEELSHPEAFIRARAVSLWAENAPVLEAEIVRMIEGRPTLDKLDLLGQRRFTALTQRWLRLLLRPAWFQTDAVRGHARMFFPEFAFAAESHADTELCEELRDSEPGVRDYFCYLLLDFAAADSELEIEPLRAAFALAAELGWAKRLEALAVKELKLTKREAQALRAAAAPAGEPETKAEDTHE